MYYKEERLMVKMRKIIYFDEASALDCLDQISNGRSEELVQSMLNKAKGFSTDGSLSIGGAFLDLFKMGAKANLKGNYERSGSNIITKTITNTLLTDFIKELDKKDSGFNFSKITNYKLTIPNNSMTFLKTLAPFIKLYTNNDSSEGEVDENLTENNIDVSQFDEILTTAKGYYEVLATKGDGKKVLRFNLEGLRNNYKLSDLQKMNLTVYGIPVGKCSIESLDIDNEIQSSTTDVEGNIGVTAEELLNQNNGEEENQIEVIDVILAGVE